MLKKIALCVAILVVIAGCQPSGPSAQDQPGTTVVQTATTVPPTNTPEPTLTPLPTDTPTQIPTSTPDAGATATAQAAGIYSELDKVLAGTDIPYKDGHLAWQQSETVTIDMTGPQGGKGILKEMDKTVTAGNFIFKSDVTWNASGVIICGAAFRSEANLDTGGQYQFYFYRLSGLPAYFIDFYDGGNFKNTITKAKFSDQLNVSNNATNQFVLVAQDDQFIVYLNGKRQGRYFDYSKQRLDGAFAFLAWQDSGEGSCEFKNSWVWVLK